jgi:5-methyltetrahydropteroyltriglutamate--homocysteine methyltransferase
MKIAATTTTTTSSLGFPRMGPNRELKFALERFWKGLIDETALLQVARGVEDKAWAKQQGLDRVTVGDHYLYDGVLAWSEFLSLVPDRFRNMAAGNARLFAMARGVDGATALSKCACVCACVRRH